LGLLALQKRQEEGKQDRKVSFLVMNDDLLEEQVENQGILT
jgi:hypothetical protein